MMDILRALRPRQWVKNAFVLVPLIFSTFLFDPRMVLMSILAFSIFCAVSSAVYLLNDIVDIESDKLHPKKSMRPLASGRLSVNTAVIVALALGFAGIGASFLVGLEFVAVVASYVVLNVLYSFHLKKLVILDVMSIAAGFMLRILGGSTAISIHPTSWLLICSALLALFLGFGKRRHELVLLEENGDSHRKVLVHYSSYYLDQMMSVVTASTVMSYILYTISEETVARFGGTKLLLTVPFVFYGIFRYLYLIHKKGIGGDPTNAILNDRPLLINVALWGFISALLIYFY